MASSAENTIMVQFNNKDNSRPIFTQEADAALTPGELVEMNTDEELAAHDAANGAVQVPMIVVENPYADDNTVAAIDHDYAAGESARYVVPAAGDILNVFIKASETIVKGVTFLASDGAGALQGITPDASTVLNAAIAVAWEDATVGGTRERHLVRFL